MKLELDNRHSNKNMRILQWLLVPMVLLYRRFNVVELNLNGAISIALVLLIRYPSYRYMHLSPRNFGAMYLGVGRHYRHVLRTIELDDARRNTIAELEHTSEEFWMRQIAGVSQVWKRLTCK